MIAHSAVLRIYTDTIHNAILFIDTSTMLDTTQLIYLIGKPCLAIIASKDIRPTHFMNRQT